MYYVLPGVKLRFKKASRSLSLIEFVDIWAPKFPVPLSADSIFYKICCQNKKRNMVLIVQVKNFLLPVDYCPGEPGHKPYNVTYYWK